ncbi:hypothetical protein Taro_051158, partial [Colocasia esculenta]|nr:hypothetical protein [Colocasia esculenta]
MLQYNEINIPSCLPKKLKLPSHSLVATQEIERTSGEYLSLVFNFTLSKPNIICLSNSDAVKFGHVTFFWNGNLSGYVNPSMEEYVEIPSDVGIAFNVQPKMKAFEIAEKAIKLYLVVCLNLFCKSLNCLHIQVCINLPNGDMVGHTGDVEATVVGCNAAKDVVKRDKNGQPLLDKRGNIQTLTSHTLHPV